MEFQPFVLEVPLNDAEVGYCFRSYTHCLCVTDRGPEELGQGQRMLDPPLRGVQDYGGGFHVRGRGAEGGIADSPRQFLG